MATTTEGTDHGSAGELQAAFATSEPARCHFEAFPPSSKRLILQWIALAKRPETRARRIADAAEDRPVNDPR
ncbi:YdeI/OmpD-associated family protein [Kribbella alba]